MENFGIGISNSNYNGTSSPNESQYSLMDSAEEVLEYPEGVYFTDTAYLNASITKIDYVANDLSRYFRLS